jgi:hypothetical protein
MPAKKTATKSAATKNKRAAAKKTPKSRAASNPGRAKSKAGSKEVTIDRRLKADRRDETPVEVVAVTPKLEKRKKVQRRRQIDPTTCERDYSDQEVAFMNAMDQYKRTSGRMFPTCSEVLEVIRGLGYVQLSPAEIALVRPEVAAEANADDSREVADEAELEAAEWGN